jgi:hypothetical protein
MIMASRNVSFKRDKKNDNIYTVTFSNLTLGEVMALKFALEDRGENSAVCRDVLAYFNNGVHDSNDDKLKSL